MISPQISPQRTVAFLDILGFRQAVLSTPLSELAKDMTKEAASAGFYESPHHGAFPKIQILTIEALLEGSERPKYPDMAMGGQTFKKGEQKGLF